MTNYLSSSGYVIYKSNLSEKELDSIKKELTAIPITVEGYGDNNPIEFKIYDENVNKIYIPKYYGLQKFGIPSINKMNPGMDINIEFTGQLRNIQIDAVKSVLDACRDEKKMGALLCLSCGQGKCLSYDTKIIMFDGSIKRVQNIKIGDILMGDDSKPRNILSIARGQEIMYKVLQQNGDSYTVNESHILSLKCSKTNKIIDIPILDYLNLPAHEKKTLFGYKVSVEFQTQKIDFDPYMIGYWLGNRNKKITINILHYFNTTLSKINPFLRVLEHHNLINDKHIPMIYKCNSRDIRLNLLAGIIDSNGIYSRCGYYLTLSNKNLFEDVLFLARSLGFSCSKYKYNKYTTFISGNINEIPSKNERKYIKVKDCLTTKIKIKKLKVDNYYGFEIDDNHRFLLGDFTVTHNTVCGISMICTLAKKTLIIVHKDFLLEQWKERIQQFAPSSRLGLIKAKIIDVENKDIVLASLQSLSMKQYDDDVFKEFGTVIIDECHRIASMVFSRALKKINFKYSIGLTATPKRKDGLTKVFKWYIGDIAYESKKISDNVQVKFYRYYDPDQEYSKVHLLYNKKPNIARMINNICEFIPRVDFIEEIILNILFEEPNRRFLILTDRRQHVELLKNMLDKNKLDCGLYYGGLKQEILKKSEESQFIIGTFTLISEGFDIKGLNTLILASPRGDIVQICGRILRDKPEDRKYIPLIIDIVDNFGSFTNQAKKRHTYYKKCKYDITDIDNIFVEKKQVNIPDNIWIED